MSFLSLVGCHRVLFGGPLLFLILMTGISTNVSSPIVSLADDARLYLGISKASDQDDLQNDLNTVYSWATGNNMKFNENKFHHVAFSTTVPSVPLLEHTYLTPGGLSIESQSVLKDLGVLLSQGCSFTEHFKASSLLCKRLSGWILRAFRTRESFPLLCLFKALVLCRIKYACQLSS